MIGKLTTHLAVAAVVLVWAIGMFVPGIDWGLPSRSSDAQIFATSRPWDGAMLNHLAPQRGDDPNRGADVAGSAPLDRTKPIVLNEDNEQIAQIIRRYRLYTYQPDEMITLMSLAQMHPASRDFDPRLYQYGGLWIYPVGGLLKAADRAHLVHVKRDLPYYYDRPEEFGKFYIVARAYSAAWGVIGILAVYWIGKRLAGGKKWPGVAAALAYVALPVVINMAHEAKPHLGGAVLMLFAIVAASRYAQSGRLRDALLAGALCGLSFGMVLSGLIAFAILPVMALLVEDRGRGLRHAIAAAVAGLLAYGATNPYVIKNSLSESGRATLASNLGNSTAMYHLAGGSNGLVNAAKLIADGASPVMAIGGLVALGGILLMIRRGDARGKRGTPQVATAVLLATPAVLVLIQMILLGAGKPGEYGRFGLIPAIALSTAAIVMASRLKVPRYGLMTLVLVAGTGCFGLEYLRGFVNDAYDHGTRQKWAEKLPVLLRTGESSLGVYAEPAPYNLPPVNFFQWKLVLLPNDHQPLAGQSPDVILRPVDAAPALRSPPVPSGYYRSLLDDEDFRLSEQRLSWADKPFDVLVRQSSSPRSPAAPMRRRPTPLAPLPATMPTK